MCKWKGRKLRLYLHLVTFFISFSYKSICVKRVYRFRHSPNTWWQRWKDFHLNSSNALINLFWDDLSFWCQLRQGFLVWRTSPEIVSTKQSEGYGKGLHNFLLQLNYNKPWTNSHQHNRKKFVHDIFHFSIEIKASSKRFVKWNCLIPFSICSSSSDRHI